MAKPFKIQCPLLMIGMLTMLVIRIRERLRQEPITETVSEMETGGEDIEEGEVIVEVEIKMVTEQDTGVMEDIEDLNGEKEVTTGTNIMVEEGVVGVEVQESEMIGEVVDKTDKAQGVIEEAKTFEEKKGQA